MARRWPIATLLLIFFASVPAQQSIAASINPDQINGAEFTGKSPSPDSISPLAVKLQVLLARAHFSPGEIDGKLGANAQKALRAFAETRQLPGDGKLTREVWQKLAADSPPVLTRYTVAAKDVSGPFLPKLPTRLDDMKDLKALSYTSPREALAEKFHVSEDLLSKLNPGQKFDQAGAVIIVPDLATSKLAADAVARLEVDKNRDAVRAFDKSNSLLAFYPATVGSEEKPSPSGNLKVVSVTPNPTYRYNPDYHFKGVKSKTAFTITPGPNNPVGTVWIQLNGEGYGIHGTPNPGKISKADSHGCVRLTNWDAEELAQLVKKGMSVDFVEGRS
jgi:lipoprotein-anchoring transpeptidase ErfK/SrfK